RSREEEITVAEGVRRHVNEAEEVASLARLAGVVGEQLDAIGTARYAVQRARDRGAEQGSQQRIGLEIVRTGPAAVARRDAVVAEVDAQSCVRGDAVTQDGVADRGRAGDDDALETVGDQVADAAGDADAVAARPAG